MIDFGLIACGGVSILAWAAGTVRAIPVGWRCIDSTSGVLAVFALWVARRIAVAPSRSDEVPGAPTR